MIAYRDKKVVGVFVRFRAPLRNANQLAFGDDIIMSISSSAIGEVQPEN
jgi:hypothetical protein